MVSCPSTISQAIELGEKNTKPQTEEAQAT